MKRIIVLTLICFFGWQLQAQPGGGGGLYIYKFYNSDGDVILKSDSTLHISALVLNDTTRQSLITRQLENCHIFKSYTYNLIPESYCALPPGNIRLFITYQNDTMLVDLLGIIDENGAGDFDFMDSVVISNGYFRYNRSGQFRNLNDLTNLERTQLLSLSGNGLTANTIAGLKEFGVIEYQAKYDKYNLIEKNLAPVFYLDRGICSYYSKDISQAIHEINKSLVLGLSLNNEVEALIWLYRIYLQEGMNDKREELFTNLLAKKTQLTNDDIREYFFTQLSLVMNAVINDATVSDVLILDLKQILQSIPEHYVSNTYWSEYYYWSEYADFYLLLGKVAYQQGAVEFAMDCWFQAEALGFKNNREIINFDSIIQRYPDESELHLLKAISLLNKGVKEMRTNQYDGSYQQKIFYENVLKEVSLAENKGSKNFKVSMIKALVLSKMGDNKKALDQINLAINSNSSYARLFLYRFEIRVKLGIATENDWEDADMISFMTLTKLRNWANDNLEF